MPTNGLALGAAPRLITNSWITDITVIFNYLSFAPSLPLVSLRQVLEQLTLASFSLFPPHPFSSPVQVCACFSDAVPWNLALVYHAAAFSPPRFLILWSSRLELMEWEPSSSSVEGMSIWKSPLITVKSSLSTQHFLYVNCLFFSICGAVFVRSRHVLIRVHSHSE